MTRGNILMRLCRALSGLTQEQFEQLTGIPNIGAYETGEHQPTPLQLAVCARAVNRPPEFLEWLLREFEQWSKEKPEPGGSGRWRPASRQGLPGTGAGELGMREFLAWAARAGHLAREERMRQRELERAVARGQRAALESLTDKGRRAVIRCEPRYQSWALAEACAELSEKMASKEIRKAMEWAELGCLIADRVEPEGLRRRTQGLCRGYVANVHRVGGALKVSEREMLRASELWMCGEDPDGVLDPGRLLELEASLRSDLGQPAEALRLLRMAEPITRRPGYVALKKGTTLAELGEYEKAVDVLVRAGKGIDQEAEPRLWNVQRFSLCSAYCHLGRHQEAARLLREVKRSAADLGDGLDGHRIQWLEGRIARARGECEKALARLEAAAAAFANEGLDYDVALARFEVATLCVEMEQPERAEEIAVELLAFFRSSGDTVEEAKALELFQVALATRRAAAGDLARSILAYLFLAQHQRGLVFQAAAEG